MNTAEQSNGAENKIDDLGRYKESLIEEAYAAVDRLAIHLTRIKSPDRYKANQALGLIWKIK